MNHFIAYFDYLGFKQFIENNDLEYQKEIIGNNFRDMEGALGRGKMKKAEWGVMADLINSNINCINFSDTIIFWTNDNSEITEFLDVVYKFNQQTVDFFFPARGALAYGEIHYVDHSQKNEAGGHYNVNSVFGKGLVKAHDKAEMQQWAGCVVDQSFIDELSLRGYNKEELLEPFAKKYKVPYKNGIELPEEYAMSLIKNTSSTEAIKNYSNGIRENFARHNKSTQTDDIKQKIENTIRFLESFYISESVP